MPDIPQVGDTPPSDALAPLEIDVSERLPVGGR
jgi:hypothetical protein